jgi:hypothetical protein
VSDLHEGVNGDEVKGDLGLRDGNEHVEEKEGSVYDEVEDRGRRECSRFGNGNVGELVSILLSEEEGMRTAMRSKAMVRSLSMPRSKGPLLLLLLLLLSVGDVLVPPNDSDER